MKATYTFTAKSFVRVIGQYTSDDRDPAVPFNQSELLAAALKKAGVEVTLQPLQGAGHGGPGPLLGRPQCRPASGAQELDEGAAHGGVSVRHAGAEAVGMW